MKKKIFLSALLVLLLLSWTPATAAESSLKTADGVPLAELMSGIGMAAPVEETMAALDFSLLDLSGRELKLSDFRGKVVLLNFFATWCGPCLWEMPEMELLYRAYKDKGFVILAVSIDFAGPETVKKFAEKIGLTFPIVMDTKKEVARKYGLRGPPLSYLIDRKGHVVGGVFGPANWSDQRAFKIVEHFLNSDGAAAR